MELDLRGLVCPVPVIKTKKAIESIDEGVILARFDSPIPAGNVARTAEQMGCSVKRTEERGEIVLEITKRKPSACAAEAGGAKKTIVAYVNSSLVGKGDEKLGRVLMKAFLQTLGADGKNPSKIIFLNSGVFLTTEGSEHLDAISNLEKAGSEVMSCGTCLDFYGLSQKLKVGRPSNMFEIVEILSGADRVISP